MLALIVAAALTWASGVLLVALVPQLPLPLGRTCGHLDWYGRS